MVVICLMYYTPYLTLTCISAVCFSCGLLCFENVHIYRANKDFEAIIGTCKY